MDKKREFKFMSATVHGEGIEKDLLGKVNIRFLVKTKWLPRPDYIVSVLVQGVYDTSTKLFTHITFHDWIDVPQLPEPHPAWYHDFLTYHERVKKENISPLVAIQGLDKFLKDYGKNRNENEEF
nr:hypothetical protein [Candidatus Sigynarchaeota archaeon]